MTRTIVESINGANLTIPTANDFFTVISAGLPNGDPCIAVQAGDSRAYAPVPTLSPNFMKNAGQGPFSLSFWMRTTNIENAKNLRFGCQNITPTNGTIWIDIQTHTSGLSNFNINYYGGTTVQFNLGPLEAFAWNFVVVSVAAPGGAIKIYRGGSSGFMVYDAALSTMATVSAGTSAYPTTQNFFIGRYSDSGASNTLTNDKYIGKIAYHNHALTLTECQMLYHAMVVGVPPSVTINQGASQGDPTPGAVTFDILFSEAVTGFIASDVVLTGTAGATTGVLSGGGAVYTLVVSDMANSGTVIANIPARVATGTALPAGRNNLRSTSTDNTVTFTGYSDNFNRANSGSLGIKWNEIGSAQLEISGNQLQNLNGPEGYGAFNTALGNDHFIEIDVNDVPTGWVQLFVRINSNAFDGSFYRCRYDTSAGGTLTLNRTNTGITGATGVGVFSFPYRMRFQIQGSTLKVYINGSLLHTTTDTGITTGPYAGVSISGSNSRADNMTCGPL